MCGVLILNRGDHRRAGEVGHALCSAHLSGLQLVTHNTVNDDNVHIDTKHIDTNNIDSDSSNSNNSDSDNSEHSNATFIPSSLLQQACPFSMSDFDTDSDDTVLLDLPSDIEHLDSNILASSSTPPLFSSPSQQTDYTIKTEDLDETPSEQSLSDKKIDRTLHLSTNPTDQDITPTLHRYQKNPTVPRQNSNKTPRHDPPRVDPNETPLLPRHNPNKTPPFPRHDPNITPLLPRHDPNRTLLLPRHKGLHAHDDNDATPPLPKHRRLLFQD